MSKYKKFHFVKYEFGTVEAESDQLASQMAAHPLAPKQSQILTIVSKKIGTPVFPNLQHEELIDRIANLETAIIWKVEHFEEKAKEIEKDKMAKQELFNRSAFEFALYEMIKNHTRSEGISWDTVEFYLNEFCLNKSN